jgi:hypothetical protein
MYVFVYDLYALVCMYGGELTTEPHAHDISTDIVRVWLSGYILQHEAKGCRFDTLETAKSGRWVR